MMSVYVDPLMPTSPSQTWHWTHSCHMSADTEEELHEMARKIGLRREWFQNHHIAALRHYDLTTSKRVLAIQNGAQEIDWLEYGRRIHAGRLAQKEAEDGQAPSI